MNTNEFERIENYFAGKCDEGEKQLFEERLNTDPDIATHVREFELATQSVVQGARAEMKKNLKNIHSTLIETGGLKAFPSRQLQLAAAVIVLLGLAGTLYFSMLRNKSSEKLFAEYFEPYPDVISNRGEINANSASLDVAIAAYKQKDFALAWEQFSLCPKYSDSRDDFILLYRGISGLMADHEKESIDILAELTIGSNKSLHDQAAWYLALAYLKFAEKEKALQMLHELADGNGFKQEEAKSLLEEIGK